MSDHDDPKEHCGQIGHQAVATFVWFCPHDASYHARVTLHDDQGTVHSQQVAEFGPFDSWLDVERWVTTHQAGVLFTIARARQASSS